MSRSVASVAFAVSSAATRARSRASSACAEPARAGRCRSGPGGAPRRAGCGACRGPRQGCSSSRGQARHPGGEGASGDPQIGRGPSQGGAGSGPARVDRLAAELLGVILAGHDRGSSRFLPAMAGFSVSKIWGQGPVRARPRRRDRSPGSGPLVHHEDRAVLRRHGRQAPPGHHRRQISRFMP